MTRTHDHIGRPLEDPTDVICDGCEGAILESERRAFVGSMVYCDECMDAGIWRADI